MSYQVIARKWRPQSFDQVVGQNHIAVTITNALKKGRVPHALLFTGPRGTGKTSSARILAKALRCENPVDFKPCGVCQSCVEIAQGRAVDVVEIDGASNNGVDAVRELRDTVGYMPSSGKYKIYIIDEVHMLSTAAFNALLKTLEEPPAHVVFILATTEAQKIPSTILSRCQRFDFRRIPARQVMEHLKFICTEEKIQVDSEALWVIARQGDGSMRDSQTLLDQVITFTEGNLTGAKVVEVLGLTDRSLLMKCLSALAYRDGAAMMGVLTDVARAGYDAHLFMADLMENLRHWLLVRKGAGKHPQTGEPTASSLVEISDGEMVFLQDLARMTSEEDIHLLFDMALKGNADLQRSGDPEIVLEMVLLRMVEAPRMAELSSLLGGNAPALTQTFAPTATVMNAPAPPLPAKAPAQTLAKATPAAASISATPARAATVGGTTSAPTAPAPRVAPATPVLERPPLEKWMETVAHLKGTDALLGAKVEQLTFVGTAPTPAKEIQIAVSPNHGFLQGVLKDANVMKKLQSSIDHVWGTGYAIRIKPFSENAGGVSAVAVTEAKTKQKEQDLIDQLSEIPKVKSAMAAFKAPIKAVRDLKKE